jgi:hypothetical protein
MHLLSTDRRSAGHPHCNVYAALTLQVIAPIFNKLGHTHPLPWVGPKHPLEQALCTRLMESAHGSVQGTGIKVTLIVPGSGKLVVARSSYERWQHLYPLLQDKCIASSC